MTDYRVHAGDVEEDQVTSLLESYSSQLPSSFYLGAAGASIVGSLLAKIQGKDHLALFVGQWAPTFLGAALFTPESWRANCAPWPSLTPQSAW